MSRPSNAELLAREPEIEEGTETAVDAFHQRYPNSKVIEAESIEDDAGTTTHYEVAGGYQEGETARIWSVKVGLDGTIKDEDVEERPNTPPGQAKQHPRLEKLDQGLKARGPKPKKTKG